MTPKNLRKLKLQLREMRKSPQGRKPDEFISIALKLGRIKDKRGKEPTYVREVDPSLSPPLSIPDHGSKDIKPGTARSIIDALLDDVSNWEIFMIEAENENEDDCD